MPLINQLLITHIWKTTQFRSGFHPLPSDFCCFFITSLLIVVGDWFFFLVNQLRPNFHPEGLFSDKKVSSSSSNEKSKPITQLWHLNGRCPEGTIPIRRTKKDDLLRASSIKTYGRKNNRTIPQPRSADPDLINESGHQVVKIIIKIKVALSAA